MAKLSTEDSILLTIKHLIGGVVETTEYYDLDLMIFLNSTFTVLAQLGVGPEEPFKVDGPNTAWTDFEYDDLEAVKEYLYLKTKLTFDPPQNGSIMQAYNDRATELEWRLEVYSEELKDG